MTCAHCNDMAEQIAVERDRRTIAEASARRWEAEAKALRREVQHLRSQCDTHRITREDKPSRTHG